MNEEFKNKYIKYKTKYLQLKSQYGGLIFDLIDEQEIDKMKPVIYYNIIHILYYVLPQNTQEDKQVFLFICQKILENLVIERAKAGMIRERKFLIIKTAANDKIHFSNAGIIDGKMRQPLPLAPPKEHRYSIPILKGTYHLTKNEKEHTVGAFDTFVLKNGMIIKSEDNRDIIISIIRTEYNKNREEYFYKRLVYFCVGILLDERIDIITLTSRAVNFYRFIITQYPDEISKFLVIIIIVSPKNRR
jgi:hypothetical protein